MCFFVRIDELDYVTVRNINVHVKIRKHFRSNTARAYIFYGWPYLYKYYYENELFDYFFIIPKTHPFF